MRLRILWRLLFPGLVLLLTSPPLAADNYQWFPQGDGTSFADDGNWYNFDKIPHNPSGPPGSADSADLISGANVTVSTAAVKTLTGAGTATFTVNGTFTAGTLASRLTLAGVGTLAGTTVTSAPIVVGGHLTAVSFSDSNISVSESGSMAIAGGVASPFQGSTVNVFVQSGGTLSIGGDASDLSGAIEGGALATLHNLSNVNTTKPTLAVNGTGTSLDIADNCTISNGSLDVGVGAEVLVGGEFSLTSIDGNTDSSSWDGTGTTVTAVGLFLVGGASGSYIVNISEPAQAIMLGGAVVAPALGEGAVVVGGAESVWNVSNELDIGAAGPGSLSLVNGGALNVTGTQSLLSVGALAGSVGIVTIDFAVADVEGAAVLGVQPGSTGTLSLTNAASFQVNGEGLGALIIGKGGSGHCSVDFVSALELIGVTSGVILGQDPGSDGDLTVTGFAKLGFATVGQSGIGQATAGANSLVDSNTVLIGENPGALGVVSVSSGGLWTNQGTVFVGGLFASFGGDGQLTVAADGRLRTASLLVAENGIVTVENNGLIEVGAGNYGPAGSVRVSEGGLLEGSGIVQGQVIVGNGGIILPGESPGVLTVDGAYQQDAGGTYDAEIGGTAVGTGFDQINVTGAATLGGNLSVQFVNGFKPVVGQTFRVLEAASVSGAFDEISAPSQAEISVIYDATGAIVTITAVVAGAAPVITSPTTANAGPGLPFSYQITATNSPTSFGATNLPAGLTVNASTGLISGTPTGVGTFIVSISASNAAGSGRANLTLIVDPIFGGTLFPPSNLLNISTRLSVQTGDNVLIGGFIVTGTEPIKVIVRGIGPSLGAVGVSGVLADPVLEVHKSDGTVITNDNWKDTQQAEITASGIAPTSDLESAIIATLDPGAHTAILSGKNGGTGIGLVEAYDLSQAVPSTLANISTRGLVQTGDNVLIGGFIVAGGGSGNSTVVVRAIGPSLGGAGVANPLADPTLELHNGNGDLTGFNDNWKDNQQAALEASGIAPTDDRESALETSLAPGAYTAIVRGANNTTGVGLVEAYNIQ